MTLDEMLADPVINKINHDVVAMVRDNLVFAVFGGIWLLGRSAFYTSIIIEIRAQHALWNSLYPENTENQDIAQ